MRNLRLLIEYDGTAYNGWQQQTGQPTIQGELNRAIERMTGTAPTLSVAGRTDAGVHATGQVASFKTESTIELYKFAPGLNTYLPNDISVHAVEQAPLDFDARYDSTSKRYRYRIYRGPQPSALEGRFAWYRRNPLDIDAMRRGAAHLLGEHDFDSFRSAHCDAEHAWRKMYAVDVATEPRPPVGEAITIVFHANAYCRHMCRILAGTLVEVGMGKRAPDDVARLLEVRDRTEGGVTAPAHGLTLLEVRYDGERLGGPPGPTGASS